MQYKPMRYYCSLIKLARICFLIILPKIFQTFYVAGNRNSHAQLVEMRIHTTFLERNMPFKNANPPAAWEFVGPTECLTIAPLPTVFPSTEESLTVPLFPLPSYFMKEGSSINVKPTPRKACYLRLLVAGA